MPKAKPKAKGSVPARAGRPSDYTPALADAICERIAGGESLRAICRAEGAPGLRTVLDWLGRHEDFRAKYTRAREAQGDVLALECIEIIDATPANDLALEHAVRRVETRQWLAAKLRPKVYGEQKGPAVAIQNNLTQGATFARFTAPPPPDDRD